MSLFKTLAVRVGLDEAVLSCCRYVCLGAVVRYLHVVVYMLLNRDCSASLPRHAAISRRANHDFCLLCTFCFRAVSCSRPSLAFPTNQRTVFTWRVLKTSVCVSSVIEKNTIKHFCSNLCFSDLRAISSFSVK